MLTFKEIVDQVADTVQAHGADRREAIRNHINNAYLKISRERDWDELLVVDETLAYTIGNKYLALPGDADEVYMVGTKTNDHPLRYTDVRLMARDNLAGTDTNSTVVEFSAIGHRAVQKPIPDATLTVTVESSNAGDTTQTVRVRGLTTNGLINSETISLNGTTPVAGTLNWRQSWSLHGISLNTECTGTITVKESDGSTAVALIPPGEKMSRHYILLLANPPSTAESLFVTYKRAVQRLIRDEDVPIIPVQDYLIEWATGKMRQVERKYAQAGQHFTEARGNVESVLSGKRVQADGHKQMRPDYEGRGIYRGY